MPETEWSAFNSFIHAYSAELGESLHDVVALSKKLYKEMAINSISGGYSQQSMLVQLLAHKSFITILEGQEGKFTEDLAKSCMVFFTQFSSELFCFLDQLYGDNKETKTLFLHLCHEMTKAVINGMLVVDDLKKADKARENGDPTHD